DPDQGHAPRTRCGQRAAAIRLTTSDMMKKCDRTVTRLLAPSRRSPNDRSFGKTWPAWSRHQTSLMTISEMTYIESVFARVLLKHLSANPDHAAIGNS